MAKKLTASKLKLIIVLDALCADVEKLAAFTPNTWGMMVRREPQDRPEWLRRKNVLKLINKAILAACTEE